MDLKPCPFCGGDPTIQLSEHNLTYRDDDEPFFEVHCDNCCASGAQGIGREEAEENWNKRCDPKPKEEKA